MGSGGRSGGRRGMRRKEGKGRRTNLCLNSNHQRPNRDNNDYSCENREGLRWCCLEDLGIGEIVSLSFLAFLDWGWGERGTA